MRPVRPSLLPAAVALAAASLLGAMGLLTPAFTDYEVEAEPALDALRAGHVGRFLELAPAYGGSLLERAPFALAPGLWGGGGDAVFRSMAVPCLLAAVLLGLHLFSAVRRRLEPGARSAAPWAVLLLAAANPLALRALEVGHPEELLVTALVLAAALLALDGRTRAALPGVLLGLAVAGKPWAVLAVVPVLALLPTARAVALAAAAAALAGGAVLLPFLLAAGGGGAVGGAADAASTSGVIFQPWQLFWFLGDHGHVVHGLYGEKVGFRAAPGWVGHVSHPLVLAAGLGLAVAGAVAQRRRRAPRTDALLLLTAVLLVRCLLDTWNTSYYALPFLLVLVTWEVRSGRAWPVLSAGTTLACWVSFETLTRTATPDVQAAFYLAWSVPLAAALAWRALAGRWPPVPVPRLSRRRAAPSAAR